MSDELKDTTPLGKSVEEIEGETQIQHPDNKGLLGTILNPDFPAVRDTTEAPTTVLSAVEHSLGMNVDESPRSPDADRDSSEES